MATQCVCPSALGHSHKFQIGVFCPARSLNATLFKYETKIITPYFRKLVY